VRAQWLLGEVVMSWTGEAKDCGDPWLAQCMVQGQCASNCEEHNPSATLLVIPSLLINPIATPLTRLE
jgi:hypothetical protein